MAYANAKVPQALLLAHKVTGMERVRHSGLSPQPIETPEGWLIIYHGVRQTAGGCLYRLGLALLDLEQPCHVIRRGDEWVFGPHQPYERVGDVGNVVFPCGVIHHLGAVGPEQRNVLLGGAYALLHLIHFAEPFGLSMVEAMACGTPVIACRRGSVPEIIRPGETGLIVQSTDEAVAALSQVRALHRARIRQHVADNFSQERMVDHYIKVYEEILRMEASKAAATSPTFEQRPWGSYTVLDEGHHYKVKRLEILPGKRLSYQKHSQRT
jgi:hypothetical protein